MSHQQWVDIRWAVVVLLVVLGIGFWVGRASACRVLGVYPTLEEANNAATGGANVDKVGDEYIVYL